MIKTWEHVSPAKSPLEWWRLPVSGKYIAFVCHKKGSLVWEWSVRRPHLDEGVFVSKTAADVLEMIEGKLK